MSGMRMISKVDAGGESLQEKELQGTLCRAVARAMGAGPREGLAELLWRLGRNREAAAIFLQAATMAESAVARESLRRRGAELISSRRHDCDRRLAC